MKKQYLKAGRKAQSHFTSPLRYPGGKGRLTTFFKEVFEQNDLLDGHYIEPYAGGAGIAINLLLLGYASCIHLNDIDRSIFAFWHSVINSPDELCKRIRDVKVNMTQWRKEKAVQLADDTSLLDLGFSTFFLNRTNRSGIILGGAIGGEKQKGDWRLSARFNKKDLCKRVENIAFYRSRVRLYNLDAYTLISGVVPSLPQKSLLYCDPPYYFKSDDLYQNKYSHKDHVAIAKLITKKIKTPWIVSYDNTPEIMEMYHRHRHITYGMYYSARKRYSGKEVMFFDKSLAIPDVETPVSLQAA